MHISLVALQDLPEVSPGDDLAALIHASLKRSDVTLRSGDVLVLCQKVISKAENRFLDLDTVIPTAKAVALANTVGQVPALVQAILDESRAVIRSAPNVLIVRHRLGFISANAGIDRSNVPGGENFVLRLPVDPDASARRIRDKLRFLTGNDVGVVINDSFGRPWRLGVTGICIGAAGVMTLRDMRGMPDREGRPLQHTVIATGDEIAAAASLAMGQAGEGTPAVLVRGLPFAHGEGSAADLLRPEEQDLFL